MTNEDIQFNKMTKTPVKKLVLSLAIPTVISMLVTSIYNMADTYFVAQLGKSASGAVGVVFSLMAIIQAVGFTLGMGSGSIISSKLGEKDEKAAQQTASSGFYLALLLGVLIAVFGIAFNRPLMKMLGATNTSIDFAVEYSTFILFGTPVMAGSFVLNNLLRSEGKAKFSMIGLASGGLLNIMLDPLFIFVFGLGIKGAAIATLISQCVSFTILLSFFIAKKSLLTLSIKNVTLKIGVYLEIIKVGFPSLCRQGLASLATILLNKSAGLYGSDAALSAMSIVSKIFLIIFSVAIGIGQGYQPVCGYNYFSKNYKRVKEAMWFTYIISTVLLTVFAIFFFAFAKDIMRFFIDDEDVIEIGKTALKYQCFAMPFVGVNVICNMTYQSTRKKFRASLLSCLRQGIFFIPLILILPNYIQLLGVELTQAISDGLTCLFSIPFLVNISLNLNKRIKAENLIIVDNKE